MIKRGYLPIFVMLLIGSVNAADYYVATTGSDSAGDGSQSTPWASLSHAALHASPGDYVYLKEGEYQDVLADFVSGSENNYITFSSYDNEPVSINLTTYPGWTTNNFRLDNKAYLRFRGMKFFNNNVDNGVIFIYSGSHDISFEDCEVQGDGEGGAVFFILDSSDITISGCDAHDNNDDPTSYDCIGVMRTDNMIIKNSEIHNCGHSGIMLYDDCDHATVFNNTIYGEPGGLYGSGIIADGTGHHIHHNKIHHGVNAQCAKCAIQWTASNSVIENNIIYSVGRHGISLHNGVSNNNIIRHNTIYDSGKYPGPDYFGNLCDTAGSPPLSAIENIPGVWYARNNSFYDNIIFNSGVDDVYGVVGFGYWQSSYNDPRPRLLDNVFYNNLFFYNEEEQKVIYFSDNETGQGMELSVAEAEMGYPSSFWSNIQADPILRNPEEGDFVPVSSSPACGSASDGGDIGALPCDGSSVSCGDGTCDLGETCTTCPDDCISAHEADNKPCNGCIDTIELKAYIDLWKHSDILVSKLITAIGIWKTGCK